MSVGRRHLAKRRESWARRPADDKVNVFWKVCLSQVLDWACEHFVTEVRFIAGGCCFINLYPENGSKPESGIRSQPESLCETACTAEKVYESHGHRLGFASPVVPYQRPLLQTRSPF